MTLVNSKDVAFAFPVMTIMNDGERANHYEPDYLTRVDPADVKNGCYADMEIVDASQRRWIVRSLRKTGKAERWNLGNLLCLTRPRWHVEFMLEELPAASPRHGTAASARTSRTPSVPRDRVPSGAGKTVKASEVDFQFPLAGFTDREGALLFGDIAYLTHCRPEHVTNETLIGMELVDNRRRRWIVRSLLLDRPLEKKRWWEMSAPAAAFDLELEEVDPIGLGELKARLVEEWELESPDDEDAVMAAPDLATMLDSANQQATGLA